MMSHSPLSHSNTSNRRQMTSTSVGDSDVWRCRDQRYSLSAFEDKCRLLLLIPRYTHHLHWDCACTFLHCNCAHADVLQRPPTIIIEMNLKSTGLLFLFPASNIGYCLWAKFIRSHAFIASWLKWPSECIAVFIYGDNLISRVEVGY